MFLRWCIHDNLTCMIVQIENFWQFCQVLCCKNSACVQCYLKAQNHGASKLQFTPLELESTHVRLKYVSK